MCIALASMTASIQKIIRTKKGMSTNRQQPTLASDMTIKLQGQIFKNKKIRREAKIKVAQK